MLRVLYIDHTAEMGGGEIALLNLVRNLDKSKVEPIVLLFADGPLVERMRACAETHILRLEPLVAKASKDELGIRSLLRLQAVLVSIRHVWRVIRFVRGQEIELVHTNSLKADILGGFAARMLGIPVIWHVRDRIEKDYLPSPVVSVFRLLCRRIPNFVIANSTATLETLHLDGRRPGVAIASGIDTARISKTVHEMMNTEIGALSTGTTCAGQSVSAVTPEPLAIANSAQFSAPGHGVHRVLYIDHTAELGGGEIALLNLIRNLDRQKVDPIILLFADGPLVERIRPYAETHVLPLENCVARISKDSLGIRSLIRIRTFWYLTRHVFRVRRLARERQVDLIHTASLKADIIGGLAGRLASIPVVWQVQDRIERDYLPATVASAFRFLSRLIPRFVIANSGATLATLQLNGRREGRAIAVGTAVPPLPLEDVAPDGIFSGNPAISPVSRGPVRIGLIGRISPWKGQHIFIEAASMVCERFPNARFEIIGAPLFSERVYEQSLHELCDRLKVSGTISFTGFINNISSYIAGLDIVVHASTTGEPFGQVIIEGMAAGKPVIATNGGGVPEIVVDGVTGMLVPMGDSRRMARAIEWLLARPDQAREMGRRGRERVLMHYTLDKMAERISMVYTEVLAHA